MKLKYYLVYAKCGHVGKRKYYEIGFPIYAESRTEAAQKCLKMPKVKKQLKNAISKVEEISYDEYKNKLIEHKSNGFVKAHTKKETMEYRFIAEYLDEPKERKQSFRSRREKVEFYLKRNKCKESSFINEYDDIQIQ